MIAALVLTLLAQTDPTPFWMPPPPPEKKESKPAKKKKKPPPVQVKPLEVPAPMWIAPNGDTQRGHSTVTPNVDKSVDDLPGVSRERASEPVAPAAVPSEVRMPKPIAPPPQPVLPPPEPTPIVVEQEPERIADVRHWTIDATFGAWGSARSDGGGRSWDLAYGLRGGYALENLEIELQLARAGGGSGSPFVSASATRNLVATRLFWVLGDRLALLLGGGGGVALSQTHYSLLPSTDSGAVASGLDAIAIKGVIEITAAARARIFRGLEARAEVSTLLRDGRLELLPLVAVGAAF
ncbi:MAG: hypothetical protein ABR567_01680 [Myxococcales bacterium]|nr:hypothetical protein [Myxococcales bacterium]